MCGVACVTTGRLRTQRSFLVIQASIQVHSRDGESDITICKWQNYIGKDGLNARIIPGLPIHRGSAGEFFFKSVSTTTLGITRKTVFALKFTKKIKADDFHMWWLQFNGQTDAWLKAAEKSKNGEELQIEVFPDLNNVEASVAINATVFDKEKFRKSKSSKHKLTLVSPRGISGVG